MSALAKHDVLEALRTIKDPELGLDLVTLGLIYEVTIERGSVAVRLTLTTPGCPLIATIVDDVRAAVRKLPTVKEVKVDLTFDPPWTPAKMTDEAKELLGIVRSS